MSCCGLLKSCECPGDSSWPVLLQSAHQVDCIWMQVWALLLPLLLLLEVLLQLPQLLGTQVYLALAMLLPECSHLFHCSFVSSLGPS